MIIGSIEISPGALHTHNDSYALTPNTTFSVLRPFRVIGFVIAGLLSAFGVAFFDLLFVAEILVLAIGVFALALTTNTIAHLVIINRELRGSDASVALWGTYAHLNRIRRDIADAVNPSKERTDI